MMSRYTVCARKGHLLRLRSPSHPPVFPFQVGGMTPVRGAVNAAARGHLPRDGQLPPPARAATPIRSRTNPR
eukprot:8255154-Lingulodinium_polyedra.AAC.1